jgi:hypothetical protein
VELRASSPFLFIGKGRTRIAVGMDSLKRAELDLHCRVQYISGAWALRFAQNDRMYLGDEFVVHYIWIAAIGRSLQVNDGE